MKLRKLYIFVEGNDDELFFKKVMLPLFLKQYSDVEIFKYAQWKRQKVELFIQSIITLNYDYIFTADIDLLETVNDKKKIIRSRFGNLDNSKISIVIKEIESWYLAGCTEEMSAVLNIRIPPNTNNITKEDFNMKRYVLISILVFIFSGCSKDNDYVEILEKVNRRAGFAFPHVCTIRICNP